MNNSVEDIREIPNYFEEILIDDHLSEHSKFDIG